MIGVRIDDAKRLFFDATKVRRHVNRIERAAMSRFGAFVMTSARGLIRSPGKKGKPSKPGSPPKNRTGILKKHIFFHYSPERGSVVIGPAKTNQVFFDGDGKPVTGTVPQVLEHGGHIKVLEVDKHDDGKWKRADLRSKRRLSGKRTRLRSVRIQPRPFMVKAFDKNIGKLDDIWEFARRKHER